MKLLQEVVRIVVIRYSEGHIECSNCLDLCTLLFYLAIFLFFMERITLQGLTW
jgi:hypothetical protein